MFIDTCIYCNTTAHCLRAVVCLVVKSIVDPGREGEDARLGQLGVEPLTTNPREDKIQCIFLNIRLTAFLREEIVKK